MKVARRAHVPPFAVMSILAAAITPGDVITATVALIMDLVGKVGDIQNFSKYHPHGVSVGAWITAVISFLLLSAVVYFLIMVPYTKAKERWFPSPQPGTPEDVRLLQEIRDLLAAERQP